MLIPDKYFQFGLKHKLIKKECEFSKRVCKNCKHGYVWAKGEWALQKVSKN